MKNNSLLVYLKEVLKEYKKVNTDYQIQLILAEYELIDIIEALEKCWKYDYLLQYCSLIERERSELFNEVI